MKFIIMPKKMFFASSDCSAKCSGNCIGRCGSLGTCFSPFK